MARKRIAPPSEAEIEAMRSEVSTTRPPTRDLLGAAAPIARIAGETAHAPAEEIRRLQQAAETHRVAAEQYAVAEKDGRLLVDLPLGAVRRDYLTRDRLALSREDEQDLALRESLRAHGQRTPIEVVALAQTPGEYGLVSGWRRMRALDTLFEETGDTRFATVRAVVQSGVSMADSIIGMVEENEIRLNLSFFERGRICALSARDGVFPDTDAAVNALFGNASEAKRSKVRSFVVIYEALADVLQYPETLSERLGLTLAKALKWDAEPRLREGLVTAQREGRIASAEDEHREILSLCAAKPSAAPGAHKVVKRGLDPARHRIEALGNGLRLEQRCYGGFTDLRIVGETLDDERLEQAFVALKQLLSSDDG